MVFGCAKLPKSQIFVENSTGWRRSRAVAHPRGGRCNLEWIWLVVVGVGLYGFHAADKRIEGLQDRVSQLESDLLGVVAGDIPDKYHEAMERLRR